MNTPTNESTTTVLSPPIKGSLFRRTDGKNFALTFALITSLFLLWGFCFERCALKATGRLMSTGGFEKKDRITHRIPISSIEEIDADVKAWLKKAYVLDAPVK